MFDDEERTFNVIINEKGQYSLWPSNKATPEGWAQAGFSGVKKECLEFVDEKWGGLEPAI